MKNTLMKSTLGMLALGLMATGAQADWEHAGYGPKQAYLQSRAYSEQIDMRQDRQRERVQAGLRSGQITRAEFRELMREQHGIRAMERHFRADGIIDAREFQRLDHALSIAGRTIRADRQDDQARHAYGHSYRYN